MLYWLTKEDRNRIKTVMDRFETLFEHDHACQTAHRSHQSSLEALDADMSNLWDKVNHALARIGGRAKKSSQEVVDPPDNGPQTLEQINLGIVEGTITEWPSRQV